jgi:hypothetical protein
MGVWETGLLKGLFSIINQVSNFMKIQLFQAICSMKKD